MNIALNNETENHIKSFTNILVYQMNTEQILNNTIYLELLYQNYISTSATQVSSEHLFSTISCVEFNKQT